MSNENDVVSDTTEASEPVVENETEVTEAPQATETTESPDNEDTDSEPEPSVKAEKPDKRKPHIEKRFKGLTADNYALKARIAELEAVSTNKPESIANHPTRSNYDSEEAYLIDVVSHRQGLESQAETHREAQEQQIEFEVSRDMVIEETIDGIVDFNEDRYNSISITDDMAEVMAFSDSGKDLLTHFYNNPKDADRIARLNPRSQIMAMAKLELGFDSTPAPKKQTNAPDPITPIKGGKAKKAGYHINMSEADYTKLRNTRRANR